MDEPTYTRGDKINAAVCLLIGGLIVAVATDVLFDVTGRLRGRRLAGQVEANLNAASRD
jgi:hypothetical protein